MTGQQGKQQDALRSGKRSAPEVLLFSEARLYRGLDGVVRAIDAANGPTAWQQHSDRLPGSRLAARVGPPNIEAQVALGDVRVHALPYLHRPRQLLGGLPVLTLALWRAISSADFSVLRLPGAVSFGAGILLRLRQRPYAVEVVGDPVSLLASGAVGLSGSALASVAGAIMRWVVHGAALGRYVTSTTLQCAYPVGPTAPSHHYSNVFLTSTDFVGVPRIFDRPARRLIAVGTQDQMYKGHDDLLRALALLDQTAGYTLTLIGDGRCHLGLRRLADELGLRGRVRFLGRVNDRARVFEELDQADLFVQPSRTEGLPRALIEAMARGLPAVGTKVGGIPELLPEGALAPPGRPDRLASVLEALARSPIDLIEASQANLAAAHHFDNKNQEIRVRDWLDAVADAAEGGRR